jgi:hypothetical protein
MPSSCFGQTAISTSVHSHPTNPKAYSVPLAACRHGLAAYLSRWGNLHISLANLIRVIIMGRFMAPGFVAAELVSVLSALVIGLALFHLQHHFNPCECGAEPVRAGEGGWGRAAHLARRAGYQLQGAGVPVARCRESGASRGGWGNGASCEAAGAAPGRRPEQHAWGLAMASQAAHAQQLGQICPWEAVRTAVRSPRTEGVQASQDGGTVVLGRCA